MTEQDLLILVIYILSLVFVYNNALDSLKDIISVEFDPAFLQQQITTQELGNLLSIKGEISGKSIKALKEVSLTVENKSQERFLYVVWDQSVISDFNKRSRRLIRLTPGGTLDLIQSQAYSSIAPGQILKEKVTAEDILNRNKETQALEINKALFEDKDLQKAWVNGEAKFSLVLVLQSNSPGMSLDPPHLLVCQFRIIKTSWIKAITWKPKPIKK
jgi:hypothetical protein